MQKKVRQSSKLLFILKSTGSAIFGEFHARPIEHTWICTSHGTLLAAPPCLTDLLFGPAGLPTTENLATVRPTLHPRSASTPAIQISGFESSSTGTASPNPAGPTGWRDPKPTAQTICTLGAPWHTLDNCWRLRERIQEMIDAKELSFNAVRPPNVQVNPLPDHGSSSWPSINMISICTLGEDESEQDGLSPFVIEYIPTEPTVGFTGLSASLTLFVIDIPARESYVDSKVLWAYGEDVGSLEHPFSIMGVTRSGWVYEDSEAVNKGKAPVAGVRTMPEVTPIPPKKVTEEEVEAFIKIIKASEYKVVEQMAKSPAHVSLLALLLSSEPHREALLRVLLAAHVPKETAPDIIEETINSIFSNTISFSDDELPSEGWAHSRALYILCKCNNYVIGRVMIDNGSALNVCPVTTLKQMNVDLNRVRPSKTAFRAFNDVGPCSFSVTFQVLDIPNAFSLLLGRPWIHSPGAVPSSLHQRLKFIVEEKLITVKGEEDYATYKETTVPYISIGDDENLPFHSFEIISVIRDYEEVGPTRTDRMMGKILIHYNYIPSAGLGAHRQGISHPIEVEEYKYRMGLGFRPSCHEIVEARRNKYLRHLAARYGTLNKGLFIPLVSHFFPGPPHIVGMPSMAPPRTPTTHLLPYQPCTLSPRRFLQGLHSNSNLRYVDSNPSEERLEEPGPIYFGEGLGDDGQVPEIEESLRRLEDRQLTPVEPTEEINVGIEEESRTLKIGTGLDPAQQTRMIDFLKEYQERASFLLLIKEEVVKQINAGFLEVCNYFEWAANIVPVEKKDERVRVCVDYQDLNKASLKDNFPLPHIDVMVYNTARRAQFSFMDGFFGYNQIRMAEEDKIKTTFTTMRGIFCYRVMPFDLKNAEATYQREYKLRLNPVKYTFGARSRKLLGFVVSECDKCRPLFRLLRKSATIEWDRECQDAFDTIKAYLVQPSVLVPPTPDRPLILYLTVRWQSLGCVLGQEDESMHTERAIYYMSKKFTEGESNYPEIEKICCALVWVMQRLQQYKLYHTIRLLSKADPLKCLLDSPSSMRNVAKWRCQLTEYGIEYVPRTSVKGQAIADYLAEFPIEDDRPINPNFLDEGILQVDEEEDGTAWKMYFDGAVNSTDSGISAVPISPDELYFSIAAKVDFPCVYTQILISSGHACNAAWECPPSRGRTTDTLEKESPLTVYDP
ncbi:hypothetical protein CRG98_016102 [Punica granatum]|uniref:G-patch domain-containing protein n=1 Tax=Punica granatum TaxID=22663 RepID=A0A2I0K4G3_PUNGR|nr:hypothetical protein CRG98_016102 [Punica granatum]